MKPDSDDVVRRGLEKGILGQITYSSERIDHSPNLTRGQFKDGGTETWHRKNCKCGILERHSHCSACGKTVVIGSGKVIARYVLKF